MTPEQETDALSFRPFEGDRDVNVRQFSDRFVRAAKVHKCQICDGPVVEGERHRALTECWDGQVGTFRFCTLCCEAMANRWNQDCGPDPLDARYSLGFKRRGQFG